MNFQCCPLFFQVIYIQAVGAIDRRKKEKLCMCIRVHVDMHGQAACMELEEAVRLYRFWPDQPYLLS